jgi:hypothetical protein
VFKHGSKDDGTGANRGEIAYWDRHDLLVDDDTQNGSS